MLQRYETMVLCAIALLSLLLTAPATMAASKDYRKTPIMLQASRVLPAEVVTGSNYTVKATVVSDGFVNTYDLDPSYGPFRVESTALLYKRVGELKALSRMEQLKGTDVYLNAAKQVAAGPIQTAKGLVRDPGGTVSGVASGIGRAFGRVSSAVTSDSPHKGNVAESALGQASYKRAYAYEFGVDPYSTYQPLQKALNDLAWTAAIGGLTVKAAFMAIPGGAGLVVGMTSSAQSLTALVRDKTPAELAQINQNSLRSMGVPDPLVQSFIMNPVYDPHEQTLLVGALANMPGVKDRSMFIAKAAEADEESVAVFQRTRAQLIEQYNTKTNSLQRFVDVDGIPVLQTKNGRIIALFPLDYVALTAGFAQKEEAISKTIKQTPGVTGKELLITGQVDPAARKALEAKGWKVEERIREKLL